MLNPFPIQFLAPLAYVLLRIAVGFLLMRSGSQNLIRSPFGTGTWCISLLQIVFGIMYFIGAYTQIAALGVIILMLVTHFWKSDTSPNHFSQSTSFLILVISMALFITGAGPFALDLPI